MDTKIFKNFQKDRKLSHSTFDMSFKNLGTSNFGQLQVKGVLPVMPSDKWSIGLNSLTKIDPMSAPAFTRIMQNTYAFYVPNQCVWSYWNDYISNGTQFLDTYGNNATNQEISDKWRPPLLAVNDLQLISKIADGWAIPVWNLGYWISSLSVFSQFQAVVNSALTVGLYVDNTMTSSYKLHYYFYLFIQAFSNSPASSILHPVASYLYSFPYVAPHFVFEFEAVSGQSYSKIKSATLDGFNVGGSYEQLQRFFQLAGVSDSFIIGNNAAAATYNKDSSYSLGGSGSVLPLEWYCFCDPSLAPSAKGDSPFFLQRSSAVDKQSRPLNCYNYYQHVPDYQYYTNISDFDSDVLTSTSQVHRPSLIYICARSGMYGKEIQIDCSQPFSTNFINCTVYGMIKFSLFEFSIPLLGSSISNTSLTKSFIERLEADIPFAFRYYYPQWSSCNAKLGTDKSVVTNWRSSVNFSSAEFCKNNGVKIAGGVSQIFDNPKLRVFAFNDMFTASPYTNGEMLLVRQLVNFNSGFQADYSSGESAPVGFIDCPEALSCGYTAFGFLIYLAKQARMKLEKFNIPVDSFVSAEFPAYFKEFIEAIPFFCESKIFNNYFRNKAVSTAELDYRRTNSIALYNKSRYEYYVNAIRNFQPQTWIDDLLYKGVNGWVIPCETLPKNSLGSDRALGVTAGSESIIERATQSFHYYDITTPLELFYLLTGFNLKNDFVRRLINTYQDYETISGTNYAYICNLFLNGIYLPSYYNGLLHQHYQNFNQDYFSSGLLDAMSGANQVAVPQTVTELRSAERKQTFWERLAMNRSFKAFSEKVFGITPYHDDVDNPLLLGSMHTRLEVGEVVQQSQTTANSSQGTRTGLGAGRGSAGLVSRKFSEYGYIIILQSHTVEVQMFQGLEKHWSPKESFLDYPFYDFCAIGNQPILERELNYGINPSVNQNKPFYVFDPLTPYMVGFPKGTGSAFNNPLFVKDHITSGGQNFVQILPNAALIATDVCHTSNFAYTSRFSEWKFKLDELHGEFRNNLDYWHTFRRFFIRPLLTHEFVNWEFVVDDNELNRLFNVTENEISDKFKVYLSFNAKVRRSLPYMCTPGM